MSDLSSKVSHYEKNTTQIIEIVLKLLPVVIIIGIIIATYYFLMNTPLGKGLKSFLGGIGGVLSTIGQQFKTCSKVGWFNVKKECYTGVLGLGVGLLFVIYKFASLWVGIKNPMVNRINMRTQKSQEEITSDALEGIEFDNISELPEDAQPRTVERILNNRLADIELKLNEEQYTNPAEKSKADAQTKMDWSNVEDKLNENLSEDEQREETEVAEEAGASVPEFE